MTQFFHAQFLWVDSSKYDQPESVQTGTQNLCPGTTQLLQKEHLGKEAAITCPSDSSRGSRNSM